VADHTAIAAVSRSFVTLLRTRMKAPTRPGDPDPEITTDDAIQLGSPDQANGARITVFLYRVEANPHTSNDRPERVSVETSRPAPLELDLHYLVTAHPEETQEGTNQVEDQHVILGRAIQIVRDEGLLRGAVLDPALRDEVEIPVELVPHSLDEVSNVWNTFTDVSFQPSVTYVVGPVAIDSLRADADTRVTYQKTRVGQPRRPADADVDNGEVEQP
jgi:hypothetical protein